MSSVPSVAAFAGLLADLTSNLRQGNCCLVVCDKGWALPLYLDLRDRLRAVGIRCPFLDGRPTVEDPVREDIGAMLITLSHLRKAVRGAVTQAVLVLPHLDLMTARDGGWTSIAREIVPLLYENPGAVVLGFQDPSLPLLPVV